MNFLFRPTISYIVVLFSCITITCVNAQKVTAPSFTMVQNGHSSAVIVTPVNANKDELLAANELSEYVFKISGARIPISTQKNGKNSVIYIGSACPNYASLAKNEYAIASSKNQLQITGATPYQTLETVYVLLEEFLGCQFLSPTVEKIPSSKNVVVAANYAYTPAVLTRTVHSKLFYDNPSFAAKRRVTTEGFPKFVPEARVHTFNKFLPEKNFFEHHPTFYALVKNKRQPTQLCLSNDTVYQIIKDSVAAFFNRRPTATVLSVSQDDNTQYCTCDKCAAIDAFEGSPSGTMITLVNRIAKDFPNKTIATLAYQYTRKAPLHIKPQKNVLVTLCSIECDRSAPIAEKCKDFESDLKAWGAIGATIQIWDYTTQFTNFLAPFPNLETLQPNINLFGDIITDIAAAICGGIGLAASGNINPTGQFPSMFEPVHGSAPDIAGKNLADPTATVLSVAMMLNHLGQDKAANDVEVAVAKDLAARADKKRSTTEIGDALVAGVL